MISIDFKIDNKVVATFTVNTDETTLQVAETEQARTGTVNKLSPIDWNKVKEFVEENDVELNDIESGVLESYITKGTVSAKQERVLPHVLRKVQERGFKPSYLF